MNARNSQRPTALSANWLGVVAAILLAVLPGSGPASAELRSVILACNDFPPLKIEKPGPDGLQGTDVEAIAEIARRADLRLEPRFMPWNRGYAEASNGTIDGLCSCSYRDDRAALFHFSEAIGQTSIGVFSRLHSDHADVTGLGDLRDHKVGVVKGYNLEAELADAQIAYQTVSTDRHAYAMLLHGRFDNLYSFKAPIEFMLRNESQDDVAYTELRNSPYYICLSKAVPDTAEMMPRINKAIAEMVKDGTFAAIQRRYGQATFN
jgi:polar amino acid transport system substrate-binding protein